MNRLYMITYHTDNFNDIIGVELSSGVVDNYTYKSPMTYLKSISPNSIKTYFKTGNAALQEITNKIKKPDDDIKIEGQRALCAFANEIELKNPEWLI